MPANQFGIDMGEIATIQANKQRTNILAQEMDMKQQEFDAKQATEAKLAPLRARIASGDKTAVNEYAAIDPKGGSELMTMYQSADKAKREEIAAGVEEYGRLSAGLAQKLSTAKDDNERTAILQKFKGFLPPELAAKVPDQYTPEVAMQLQQGITQARTVKDFADEEFNTKKNNADNVLNDRRLRESEKRTEIADRRADIADRREVRIAAGGGGGSSKGKNDKKFTTADFDSAMKLAYSALGVGSRTAKPKQTQQAYWIARQAGINKSEYGGSLQSAFDTAVNQYNKQRNNGGGSKAGSKAESNTQKRTVVQTGVDKRTGKKVYKYNDGSVDYGN